MGDYAKLQDGAGETEGHSQPGIPAENLAELNTPASGLTSAEANRRLQRDGPNALPEKKQNACLKFLSYYWGPMPIMIWIAIIIELIRLAWLDFAVLSILQFVNGFVGWHEEKNAGDAIAALKKNLAPKALAKRDNKWDTIDSVNLVIGDRVGIKLGDIIPADLILGPGFLEVDQSALTGESLAVTRYEGEQVYQGSVCKRGDLEAVVCATGERTFFGKTSKLVGSVDSQGNFQKIILRVTAFLMVISIVLVIIILIVVLSKGNDLLETLAICVVLLVSSIPIAMQVVCTTTMAVGSHALAKKKAIVSRLSSIEELAGMTILCSDKTGTLTKNELTVKEPRVLSGFDNKDIYLYATLACKREEGGQDAIDRCLTTTARTLFQFDYDIYEEEDFVPFDPKIKRTEATVRNTRTGETFKCSKGAPQIVLSMTADTSKYELVSKWVDELASGGYRTLGVAKSDDGENWDMIGLIPLYDPPRDDTAETIKKAIHMEVSVKMITGDQTAIARETARELRMGDRIYNSDLLTSDNPVSAQMLDDLVEEADGFAEVFPEHKFAIVDILQKKGHRVGMTGDGVNDAPALKKADVGIAVQGATDAARAAADIVLTNPGLSVIIEAIYRSRKIFQRMCNYCIYRIACTFQLLVFFFISMIAIDPSVFACQGSDDCDDVPNVFSIPVIALVIITVLNDGTIISIAYDRVTASKKPEVWNLPLIFANACCLGGVALVSSLILLLLSLSNMYENEPNGFMDAFGLDTFSYGEVLTAIYLKVSLSDFFTVFAARTNGFFWTRKPGRALSVAFVVATFVSTILACYWYLNLSSESGSVPDMEPVSWRLAGFIWGYNVIFFLIQDAVKVGELKLFAKYYAMQGKGGGYTGQILTDSFLVFSTGTDKGVRGSIITRRSVAAANQHVRGSMADRQMVEARRSQIKG